MAKETAVAEAMMKAVRLTQIQTQIQTPNHSMKNRAQVIQVQMMIFRSKKQRN